MKWVFSLLLLPAMGWGAVVSAHPLQPESKAGFAAFQGMHRDPNGESMAEDVPLVVSVTTQPEASLVESIPVFRRQAAELIKIAESIGLEISPKGAAMKVFSSGW